MARRRSSNSASSPSPATDPNDYEMLDQTDQPGKICRSRSSVMVAGRGFHRCPAGLRSAHQRAGRQFPASIFAAASASARSPRQCRPALRHRARRQGDFGAAHPRPDHRRLRPDLRAISPSNQANNLAILLRAGALPAKLTIVEERTVGPGLGQDSIDAGKRAAFVGAGLVLRYMLVDLRHLRHFRQYRAGRAYRLHFRRLDPARRDADVAGHRRHRADDRHGGRFERADL